MWESFTIYGQATRYKAEYYEYDIDTSSYSLSPVEFWFSYVTNAEESELVQPMIGFYTASTSNEIYIDGHLDIPFKENDKINIDGGENMIVKVKTPRTNRKGIQAFDFTPTDRVRRFLVLS